MSIIEQKLLAICNGCSKPMRDMGEWPIQIPKDAEQSAGHVVQCRRFACKTCRIPNDSFAPGYPVMVALIDTEAE